MSFTGFLVSLLFVFTDASSNVFDLDNKLIGTVVSSCHQVAYHTPISTPYPANLTENPFWIAGTHAVCLQSLSDVLLYCQEIYDPTHEGIVHRAISNPFALPLGSLPSYAFNTTTQIYLCLGPSTAPTESVDPTKQNITSTSTPRLPSLMDIHKAYFAQRFRHLSQQTGANVSHLIEQLTKQSRGLATLHAAHSSLVNYSTSQLLRMAHKGLEQIWSTEARQWSELEDARHKDLMALLHSEDWAGENEFTYALQEFRLDLNRIQNALSRLLQRLADSVNEEVLHLKAVQSHQPWALTLNSTDWTNHVTRSVTNIEQVHNELLKYVRTATLAINTVRSLMSQHTNQHTPRSYVTYKPDLLTSYNRLQNALYEAERVLHEAKNIILHNVTHRMHAILRETNHPKFTTNHTTSDYFITEWLRGQHHAELAFIDLLIMRLVDGASHANQSHESNGTLQWETTTTPMKIATTSRAWTLQSIVASSWAIVVCLCGVLAIVTTCLVFRCLLFTTPHKHPWYRFYTHKFKHLISASRKPVSISTTWWKVDRNIVHIVPDSERHGTPEVMCAAPLLQSTTPHTIDTATPVTQISRGYMNPTCSS